MPLQADEPGQSQAAETSPEQAPISQAIATPVSQQEPQPLLNQNVCKVSTYASIVNVDEGDSLTFIPAPALKGSQCPAH